MLEYVRISLPYDASGITCVMVAGDEKDIGNVGPHSVWRRQNMLHDGPDKHFLFLGGRMNVEANVQNYPTASMECGNR